MEQNTVIRIIRIVLIVLALILFIWFIIWLFSPRGAETPTEPVDTSAQNEMYPNVRYIQDGKITAPQQHYTISITVTAASARIDVYNGYDVGPSRSESYVNSQASYDAFYAALKNVGFFNEREDPTNSDRTSFCPLGTRYSYQAGNDITEPSLNTWSASCSSRAGTFAGNKGNVKTLFKNQIPDYTTITKGVSL